METKIPSPGGTLEVLEQMEKFFRVYPPEKAERMFWEVVFLQGDYEFNMLPEETIREFTDFIQQMNELELAIKNHEEQQGDTEDLQTR